MSVADVVKKAIDAVSKSAVGDAILPMTIFRHATEYDGVNNAYVNTVSQLGSARGVWADGSPSSSLRDLYPDGVIGQNDRTIFFEYSGEIKEGDSFTIGSDPKTYTLTRFVNVVGVNAAYYGVVS